MITHIHVSCLDQRKNGCVGDVGVGVGEGGQVCFAQTNVFRAKVFALKCTALKCAARKRRRAERLALKGCR